MTQGQEDKAWEKFYRESGTGAFFNSFMDELLTPEFLGDVRKKFHFREADGEDIRSVAQDMLPLMRREAFWERKGLFFTPVSQMICQQITANTKIEANHLANKYAHEYKDWHGEDDSDAAYDLVAMSLGRSVDCLQESYHKKGLFMQSYMAEALAGELLMRGYDAYSCYIANSTGWHVSKYHFPGSEEGFPLEMLPRLLNVLTKRITCNSAFCMLPQKSVVFISELSKDETVQCKAICAGCNHADCPLVRI